MTVQLVQSGDVPRSSGAARVRALAQRVARSTYRDGRAGDDLRRELERADREVILAPHARARFQDLLARTGVATTRTIGLPLDNQPFWFRGGQPLAGFRSHAELPATADVVIIGAGLTGASAAYHLATHATRVTGATGGARVVLLDRGDPAGEASGRNGGNFELMPENSVGMYEGLARERAAFLRRSHPALPAAVVQAESERQASLVLGLALRNRELLKTIILREHIDCDFSPRGWLHLASTEEEEQGMCEEVMLAAQHGQRMELWSRRRIREEFGIENPFLGRFIPGDGTYHPFKYACGLVQRAVSAGVELYTRTCVTAVRSDSAERHHVETDQGAIVARCIIVATNAFTSRIFPELAGIQPYQSQIMVTEHAVDRARGRVVTCDKGPAFLNQPRSGVRGDRAPLLLGGGADRRMSNPDSRKRSPRVHVELLAIRDRFYPELRGVPPSAEWIGPMAFTRDQLPAVGVLRPGVVVAAGYNGYGGTYTTACGAAAAEMAITGETPDWLPEEVFSPRRLLTAEPLFMTRRHSLWRIVASLGGQLNAVNRRISEALMLRTSEDASAVPRQSAPRVSRMMRAASSELSPGSTIDARLLAALPVFRQFTTAELDELLGWMQRWDVPRGTLLFREGDPGGSCYVVVSGVVDMSVKVTGQAQLLAQHGPGAIFGQANLVGGEPRPVSCSIRRDAVLAELGADACERLLDSGSPLALKLLGALNEGLVAALRYADRQLMRLDAREWA